MAWVPNPGRKKMDTGRQAPNLKALGHLVGGTLVWFALAFVIVTIFLFTTIRIGSVGGEEVGILLNRLNGKMEIINQSGARIYNGVTHEFYVLDKTLQTVEMTETVGRGERQEKDDLKIKTIDGSDVYVDLKVLYKIKPELADIILRTSGPDTAYKEKWVRDYVRSTIRNYLGELTTEEFYDSAKRNAKIPLAKKAINDRLEAFGINIDSIVIPQKPHFYKEYEEMIKKKKLADQGVFEEESKANAAKQKQETAIVLEQNKMNVEVEQYKGQMEQTIIAAKAEANRNMRNADAYYDKITIGAEAKLYEQKQTAEGTLAKKMAEAQGIEALKKALEGEGGRNMVKMEYAGKLKDIKITGQPFTIQSDTERFSHVQASSVQGRKAKKEKVQ